jgi:uncharacterized membrane protein YkvI
LLYLCILHLVVLVNWKYESYITELDLPVLYMMNIKKKQIALSCFSGIMVSSLILSIIDHVFELDQVKSQTYKQGWFFSVIYFISAIFLSKICRKLQDTVRTVKKRDLLKGVENGSSYFSLIFSYFIFWSEPSLY